MPRASDKTKPLYLYPSIRMAERIEAIAATEGRSANQQVLAWLRERPELREADDGG